MNWVPWVLSGISALIALVGLVRTFRKDTQAEYEHLRSDVALHHERLGLIEVKLGVFWRLVEEQLSGLLKKPTHAEMDCLLDKLKMHTLTLPEAQTLRRWLQDVYLDKEAAHAQERLIATLVMAAVEALIHEMGWRAC